MPLITGCTATIVQPAAASSGSVWFSARGHDNRVELVSGAAIPALAAE